MVCLDTDIIIDFLRNEKYAVNKIKEIKEKDTELTTTSINSFELLKGIFHSKNQNSKEALSGFLSYLKILNFDFEASEKAAEIFESLKVKGQLIDPLDLMIASIAIVNNELLITRNLNHFERISGLKLEKFAK